MGIRTSHILQFAVQPVLAELEKVEPKLNSRSAELLLLGTAAKESDMGYSLHQVGGGPARGIFQAEPPTIRDDLDRIQRYHPEIWEASQPILRALDMETDLKAAVCHCRLHYWLIPERLPLENDPIGFAQYWYKHWCRGCAGTIAEFTKTWDTYVKPVL